MLYELTTRLNQLKGAKSILENNLKSAKTKIEELETKLDTIEKAREIIRIVALDTLIAFVYQVQQFL